MATATRPTLVLMLAGVLALAGCAAEPDARSSASGAASPASSASPGTSGSAGATDGGSTPAPGTTAEATDDDCDDIEAAVGSYVDGMVPREGSGVDEFGTACGWVAAAGSTGAAALRTVEVSISSQPSDALTPEDLTAAGLTQVPDAAIEAAGGIAYTTEVPTDAASVIVTIVSMPDSEISVTGSSGEGEPALDGPAAVGVAKVLLGLS